MSPNLTTNCGNVNSIAENILNGKTYSSVNNFDQQRQERLEKAIQSFIKSNKDVRRIDLSVMVSDLLGGDHCFSDQIYEMRECLRGLTAIMFNPVVIEQFNKVASASFADLGPTLTRLLHFFYRLDNSQAQAQISQALLSESLVEVSCLESLEREYL